MGTWETWFIVVYQINTHNENIFILGAPEARGMGPGPQLPAHVINSSLCVHVIARLFLGVRACARACMGVCVCVRVLMHVRAFVHACVRACVCPTVRLPVCLRVRASSRATVRLRVRLRCLSARV